MQGGAYCDWDPEQSAPVVHILEPELLVQYVLAHELAHSHQGWTFLHRVLYTLIPQWFEIRAWQDAAGALGWEVPSMWSWLTGGRR
jgi:hypothetical protein